MDSKNFHSTIHCILILFGSFVLYFVSMGIAHCFGILYPELINYFEASRSDTSWIASLGSGLMLAFGPFAGIIEQKFGNRAIAVLGAICIGIGLGASSFVNNLYLLYLTYGVITGIGFCFCHVAANVSVNVHFDKRRALAAGVTSTGNAVGTIVLPIIGSKLIDEYTWRGTFFILSGIGLQGAFCGFVFRKHKPSIKTINSSEIKGAVVKKSEEESINITLWTKTRRILTKKGFLIFMFSGIFVSLAYFVPFVMLPDMLIEEGFENSKAALIITISGVASIISRIVFGFLSDFPWWNRLLINGISLIILGAGTSTLVIIESDYLYFLYSALLGIVTGLFGMYQSVIVVDIMGKEDIGLSFGYLTFFEGLAVMIGPPIAGLLYDITDDYDLTFIVSGILFAVGGILSILASTVSRSKCPKE